MLTHTCICSVIPSIDPAICSIAGTMHTPVTLSSLWCVAERGAMYLSGILMVWCVSDGVGIEHLMILVL